jgi:glycosyltransferase involved in cell wall biosynthesis
MTTRPGTPTSCAATTRCDNERRIFAVVVHALEGGGSRRDVILLCNALVEKCIPVTILTLCEEGPLRSLLDPRVKVSVIPGGRIRHALPGLRRAFRAIKPRLVLSSESSLNLCCLAAVRTLPKANRPSIVLREVASPSPAQQHDPSWQSRLSYRILQRFYRYADRVITLTDGARDDLLENFSMPADKVVVMRSNAVITPEIAERVARWDGEEGREPNLIVSVGRLSPEKDHLLLLRALAIIGRRRPWRLVLVGDGSERSALEDFANANGLADRITFAGYMADPFAWLMRAKIAVCSSVYEGLCNAIIEALGCGTPVVSTDCPYGPREILQYGRFGTLVPVGDASALASAIDAVLDRPVDRTTLIGRALDYSTERAADSFLEITSDL